MDDFWSNLRRYVMLISLFLYIQSCYGARVNYISKEEDMEIERQLKVLNKPPVKTIVAKHGDIIDCIDIFSQPAFDHPLLKDHKIEVASNLIQEENISKISSSTKSDIQLHREKCPPGTVPIRRTQKRELILGSKYFWGLTKSKNPNNYPLTPMYHHSQQKEKKYYGGYARIGLHNPSITQDQFSTAQIWIQNGPEKDINSIEIGWAVYPKLFGNNITRLFAYWTADGYKSTGCFNMLCPGFIQVHPSITFGELLQPISVYGGKKYSMLVRVYRAPASGDWWLFIEKEAIGYWPRKLFTHLANDASVVRYGGIAGAVFGRPSPPMGNGHFPAKNYDLTRAGYIREMKVFNEKGEPDYFDFDKTLKKQDTNKDCYDLDYYSHKEWNHIMYGGPGGSKCP